METKSLYLLGVYNIHKKKKKINFLKEFRGSHYGTIKNPKPTFSFALVVTLPLLADPSSLFSQLQTHGPLSQLIPHPHHHLPRPEPHFPLLHRFPIIPKTKPEPRYFPHQHKLPYISFSSPDLSFPFPIGSHLTLFPIC